jgi:hypothetical protein
MTSFQIPQERTYQHLVDSKQIKTSSGLKAASTISSPPHLSMDNPKEKQDKFDLLIAFITDHLGEGCDHKTKFISYFCISRRPDRQSAYLTKRQTSTIVHLPPWMFPSCQYANSLGFTKNSLYFTQP